MNEKLISVTKYWLEKSVIDLNLCPFAQREYINERVRFAVCETDQAVVLLQTLHDELRYLRDHPDTATTLLIHPNVLTDFADYNQFLDVADGLLEQTGMLGEYQIASFHPDYQFAGTQKNDAENFTNRSPYPLLHILRESMVESAAANHPNIAQVPIDNVQLMRQIGFDELQLRFRALQNR